MNDINTLINTDLATRIAKEYKHTNVNGRYVTIDKLEDFLFKFNDSSKIFIKNIGKSEENRNIYQVKMGNGNKKILIWTQMHGNESTGTKSVID